MFEIKNFQYRIGNKHSPKVELKFPKNSINLIVGNNGEGKTLFFKTLCASNEVISGSIFWRGMEKAIKDLPIAFSSSGDFSSYNLKLIDYLNYISYLYSIDHNKIQKLLNFWQLNNHSKTLISNLSDGERKRLSFVETELICRPICFYDEPEASLDINFRGKWLNHLRELSQDKLILVITHFPELYKDIGDQIINFKEDEIQIQHY